MILAIHLFVILEYCINFPTRSNN